MRQTDKKCGLAQSIARYNLGLIAEICGPVTGFLNLRVKRINKIKGEIVMWERGFEDVILEPGEMKFVGVAGCHFPALKGTNGVKFVTYVDVLIGGKLNRIGIFSASVAPDAMHAKHPFEGSVPVVSGWVKDPKNPKERDDHFSDPLCPAGYAPLIKEYVKADFSDVGSRLRELGLDPVNVGSDYVMEKPYLFDKLYPSVNVEANASASSEAQDPGEAVEEKPSEDPNQGQYAELIELKKLLDQGIITQAEFEEKKSQILGIAPKKARPNKGFGPLCWTAAILGLTALVFQLIWWMTPVVFVIDRWNHYQSYSFFEGLGARGGWSYFSYSNFFILLFLLLGFIVYILPSMRKSGKAVRITLAFLLFGAAVYGLVNAIIMTSLGADSSNTVEFPTATIVTLFSSFSTVTLSALVLFATALFKKD